MTDGTKHETWFHTVCNIKDVGFLSGTFRKNIVVHWHRKTIFVSLWMYLKTFPLTLAAILGSCSPSALVDLGFFLLFGVETLLIHPMTV